MGRCSNSRAPTPPSRRGEHVTAVTSRRPRKCGRTATDPVARARSRRIPVYEAVNLVVPRVPYRSGDYERSEEHTSELQSLRHLVCRLLLEKKKKTCPITMTLLY